MNNKNKVWYIKVDGKDVAISKKGGWVKIDGEDVWTHNELLPNDTYNQKRVDNFTKNMNEAIESYEKEIKDLEQQRDRIKIMYQDLIRKEEAKKS
tara:strand:- start:13 stop:297 length:285 start_codon:yes stop_codon:yes gene_type:complete